MTGRFRVIAGAVGGLMMLGAPANSTAQAVSPPSSASVVRFVSTFPPGAIEGIVEDEANRPVAGAVVTVVGTSTTLAVSDKDGRFEFQSLPPGPYLIRAHLAGYTTPPAQLIQVRSTVKAASVVGLKRSASALPILAAGIGIPDLPLTQSDPAPALAADPGTKTDGETADGSAAKPDGADPSETVWRIRHARRTILKDETFADLLEDDDQPSGSVWTPLEALERAAGSSAQLATSFLADTAFTGQLNFLTSGSFDAPQQLFSPDMIPGETANVSVSAPVGDHADWTARGAVSQADIASWMVAGSYTTRVPARNRYDVGMSYSMQRYDGGNPLALRSLSDGGRNAGEVYAFDTLTIVPAVALSYGARYSRYDYLDRRNLLSPRVELSILPSEQLRIRVLASKGAHAPGTEEFLPPTDSGIWLPPQRTFSSLDPNGPLRAETTTHAEVEVQRDIAASSIGIRVFNQHVSDQFVTVFGAEIPNQPVAKVGHYLVGTVGNAQATGCTAHFSTALSAWVRGSVEYSIINANLQPTGDIRYLVLASPSTAAPRNERIHDVSTTVETHVPETDTRVVVFYRISNGFARPASADATSNTPAVDSRFDVQVRQSLPFMNFTNAKWEMLVAVRNFFHEASPDQSVYDELMVVRPPKRIVGGLTMHF